MFFHRRRIKSRTYLCEDTIDISEDPILICAADSTLNIFLEGTEQHVSMNPKESVQVECAPLVRFDSSKVLANAPKHGILPHPHVVPEEQRDLPIEE